MFRTASLAHGRFVSLALLFSIAALGTALVSQARVAAQGEVTLKRMEELYRQGNYKEAYEAAEKLFIDPDQDPAELKQWMHTPVNSLQQLGRYPEVDGFLQRVVEAQKDEWQVLQAVANQTIQMQNWGVMIDNEFQRGPVRGGGERVNSMQRDRVRALQLFDQALKLAKSKEATPEMATLFADISNYFLRLGQESWRLQTLTDISELPDYDEGYPRHGSGEGAPVDEDGNPVFYTVPDSWEAARSDGQRMRWAMQQVTKYDPSRQAQVKLQWAHFLESQFGVSTLQQYQAYFLPRAHDGDDEDATPHLLQLGTLKDNETIARLATGIKRFELPDEFNHIKVWESIIEEKKPERGGAYDLLAGVYENRRQYPKAAEVWRKAIDDVGPGSRNHRKDRLQQIVGNLGQFQGGRVHPAGKGATLQYLFRNGKQVELTAERIKVEQLLSDVKQYIKSNPGRVEYEKINFQQIGERILFQGGSKYLGEQVAEWTVKLDPRPDHLDRRIDVNAPLQNAGAYMVTAKMQDGNIAKMVVWVADTAIVSKPLDGKKLYYVADAVTGQPIEKANVEFFGYKMENIRNRNEFNVLTKNFAEFTDANGQITLGDDQLPQQHQWLIMARTKEGRFAYLGFQHVWYGRQHDQQYNQIRSYGITDRPVYRPNQTLKFKFWTRRSQYDQENVSQFAGQTMTVQLHDAQGNEIFTRQMKTDQYGGLEGEWEIPSDAKLGQYNLHMSHGNVQFRVEEYKKPEFEVTVEAPKKPVALGEKITAKINAKYYFGSPVTNATVTYRVQRSTYNRNWYPPGPWDWCFGPGYWWFAYDYPWYPGFHRWVGSTRPAPSWIGWGNDPPELVAERTVEIGEDGTVDVEIDTAMAQALHGDEDHQYTITAEVRDQSRRTIVGTGKVLVAREPFKVYTWVDQGYYNVGDTIEANFLAQTLDGTDVAGKGNLQLLKITYDEKKQPIETPVQEWELDLPGRGPVTQKMEASAPGQYRLSLKVTDEAGHTQEGGYIFTIRGQGFDGSQFRFNALELIPDKKHYQAGDTVRLQINTDRVGGTILLFVRPSNGVYLPPKTIRLTGKSTIHEIAVLKKDMPNFFVEAVTVFDAEVHDETKEIVVPPETRVLDLAVETDAKEYLPGAEGKIRLKLTDHTGEPFVGSTVLTVYDKSVEYISGGSNIEDIKEFFWKWRRNHYPNTEHSLTRYTYNLTPKGETALQFIGSFGHTVADELNGMDRRNFAMEGMGGMGGIGGGGRAMPMARGMMAKQAAPMSAAAPAQDEMAFAMMDAAEESDKMPGGEQPQMVEPTVRSNFADTALWVGSVETNEKGEAEFELTMPENLTTWKIRSWAMGHGTKVGQAEADVVTRKNLIVRLQAPRFFVQKDEVVLSANVHNYLKGEKTADVTLEIPEELMTTDAKLTQSVTIPAGGEVRVDWRVKVIGEGQAQITMKALTDEESDAMQQSFPVLVHGMLKTEAWAGTVQPEQNLASITVDVPKQRRPEQSRLVVRYSPSLAAAMVDALPYMIDYPYGCTEQTLNRFVPTVITQKVLNEMGIDLKAIAEHQNNLNAQQLGAPDERRAQWDRDFPGRVVNPVYDLAELQKMVKTGVQRLTEMQNSDGGWGWFSGYNEYSYPHTTAVVVRGLVIAERNGAAVVPDTLERGKQWLINHQQQEVQKLQNADEKKKPWKDKASNLDAIVFATLVELDHDNPAMRGFLYRDRTSLSVYANAMFALALHQVGDQEKLAMLRRNLEQYLVSDEENETAYLKMPAENYWWFWYGDPIEANAYYLKLLAATDPQNVTARRLVKYLLNNRKHATYWKSTRDTALCVEAMADYLRASGELNPEMTVEIFVDGEKKAETEFTKENLFIVDNTVELTGEQVTDGRHKVEIRRKGEGPVYFNAYLTNFTLEDFITKAGLEVKVERRFYRLDRDEDAAVQVAGQRGQVVDQKVLKYNRTLLENEADVVSGDLIEVELVIESKNDYEYLMFEDKKAAGFEPVQQQSGYTGNALRAYQEFRDDRVTFFVRELPRGKHSMTYRLRAEIPGRFSALPAVAQGMYAPELVGNSDEMKIAIEDQE